MRLNKYIALATGISRRAADEAVLQNRVLINGQLPSVGQQVRHTDVITLDGAVITAPENTVTLMMNKPVGYVCSRDGQGNKTIYDLLPPELQTLKPIGRLDKDSCGLLLMTTDGQLAYELTHPRFQKIKRYEVTLDKSLLPLHHQMINDYGIRLEDGLSKLTLEKWQYSDTQWIVTMREGRNRQIRRTFAALGYTVTYLNRIQFSNYKLAAIEPGEYTLIEA